MKLLFSTLIAVLAMTLHPAAQAQGITGDAAAGEKKNAMCIGCHGIKGYQASFPEVHKVPMIAGQNAAYIAAALTAYKKGDRKHPTMRGIAETLSEQDIADLAAYYSVEGGPVAETPAKPARTPGPLIAELLKKGNCAACHGENFNQPIDASYPKLAGQHADYLYVALKAYKNNANAVIGRNNAIMSAQVKPYSLDELDALADYIGSLPSEMKTVPQPKFR
ncbi:MAG: c-type cytochrome [Methylibium sp.]|uniref:c-type cytochrome n=1 Tax=Methylibium sp. TaxID=2067992 RepID=UPI0017CE94C4|nr:c-type cytochrome [Methylibium sp.]MBA3596366.1 c-type cytochrome [Methylibium sp.]